MKKLQIIILLFTCAIYSYAQDSINDVKSRRDASFKLMAPHGYLRLFLNEDLNETTVPIQLFMAEVMKMTMGDNDNNYKITKLPGGRLQTVMSFHDQISYTKPAVLKFNFVTTEVNHISVIKSASITGDRKRLIEFFVYYWNTKLQASDKAAVIAVRNMPTEKVSLVNNNGVVAIAFAKL